MRPLFIGLIACGLSLQAPAAVAGGDAKRGAEKATAVCAACHGAKGVSASPTFPHIGGQYENYLVHALKSYKNGERKNAIMQGQVGGLTESDMEDLAAYYASQRGVLKKAP